jgi:hypothetical protein
MEARTVCGHGPDGLQPGAGLVFLPDELNGLRLEVGRSTRVQGRRSSSTAPGSRFREGPRRGGEILGLV